MSDDEAAPARLRNTRGSVEGSTESVPAASAQQKPPRLQPDPSRPGRYVKHKKANQAYLVHSQWREMQAEKRRKGGVQEDEAIQAPSLWSVVKWSALVLLAALTLGVFVTGDPLYGYHGRWRNPRRWLPQRQHTFSPAELALYNGRDPSRPIYLSILGNVYDVTAGGPTYRPGGAYSFFSGVDASRAFSTGCFQTHLTHDLRGLSDEQIQGIQQWERFFAKHAKYFKVGTVDLPEVDPDAPIPPPCN